MEEKIVEQINGTIKNMYIPFELPRLATRPEYTLISFKLILHW